MNAKKTMIGLLLIITALNVSAQDYFIVKKDTTFCNNLFYTTTIQGYLKSIVYTDLEGNKVTFKGYNNIPDVLTFYIDSVFIDKTPLKANKPNSYIRYTQRAVDGKLKVYLGQQGYNSTQQYTPGSPHGDWSSGGPSGIYRFYLKMPDGSYYKINNKSNMKKYIKPYLLKCMEFKKQYKGDFSTREQPFMDMITLYNSLCK